MVSPEKCLDCAWLTPRRFIPNPFRFIRNFFLMLLLGEDGSPHLRAVKNNRENDEYD
jgi:hypothetical protein